MLKGFGGKRTLKELAEEFGAQGEYRSLFKEARLGRQYAKQLRDDVVRLCLSLELGVAEPTLRSVFENAAGEDLMAVKAALETRLAESLPMMTQLGGSFARESKVESGFLI